MKWREEKSVHTHIPVTRPRYSHIFSAAVCAASPIAAPAAAQAQTLTPDAVLSMLVNEIAPRDLMLVSIALGAILFGVITGMLYIRARMRSAAIRNRLEAETAELRHRADRAEALLAAEDAVVISWATNGRAEIIGSLSGTSSDVRSAAALLDFPSWLRAASAEEIVRAIEHLRAKGEPFNRILYRGDGTPVEADGRIRAGRAILRLRHAYGQRALQGAVEAERDKHSREINAMRNLLKHVKMPVWVRDGAGSVVWANEAYAAMSRTFFNGESGEGRDLMRVSAASGPAPDGFQSRFPKGSSTAELSLKVDDRIEAYNLVEYEFEGGAFGVAERRTNRESDAAAKPASYKTFNQLNTGIALFNADRRLVFANDAFRSLFDIEQRWTMPGVDHAQILDALREAQYLPLEVDYRSWKADRLDAYTAGKTKSEQWHLPDGRTIRVVTDPQPDGGIACLYDDETESLSLKSQFNSLMRRQRETLDNMREAVAVFSSDGRLDFSNPAFAQLWGLEEKRFSGRPHIEKVIFACQPLYDDPDTWMELRHTITDVADSRRSLEGRMNLTDGRAIEYTTLPLPDGATLITFANITDQVAGERVLRDRNDALEAAAKLKNSFIQHVSYELRTPLTSVIGFAELLNEDVTGPLEPKQAEYISHILASSDSLLAIIDNILDLATIDAGAMELEYGDVDVMQAIQSAANGVRDRLKDSGLRLRVRIQEGLTSFEADESRVRQILYNLLSNAIGFSEKGQTISLTCDQVKNGIRFMIEDQGRGIDPEDLERIFDRFVTKTGGTEHRGAGLGLSMVKSFVELHGGRVAITSERGLGTTVSCIFPARRGEALPDDIPASGVARIADGAPNEAG